MEREEDTQAFTGRPMPPDALAFKSEASGLPAGARIISIEEAREALPRAKRSLSILQGLHDEILDVTEELEIVLETTSVEDDAALAVAEHLGDLVAEWHDMVEEIECEGTRISCIEPARLEWFGVVDGHLAMYSWNEGEEDIEWYRPCELDFRERRLLLEA